MRDSHDDEPERRADPEVIAHAREEIKLEEVVEGPCELAVVDAVDEYGENEEDQKSEEVLSNDFNPVGEREAILK